MLYKILITLLLIATSNAQNFKNQFSGGYSGRGGNTEYWYYNLNYALTANGDINFGSLTLKDSEFLLSLDRNVSEYNGAPYYNDQTIVFKFDLWANGTFSPFVIVAMLSFTFLFPILVVFQLFKRRKNLRSVKNDYASSHRHSGSTN